MSKRAIIPGGYYIKARATQGSKIAQASPNTRETWDWLLMKANHTDAKYHGRTIKRGQLFCSWRDIQNGLSWRVGYREMRYSQAQCENATKWLMKAEMITATKTTRGRIITIVNYDLYQNPANYECRSVSRSRSRPCAEALPNGKQKDKKEKKEECNKTYTSDSAEYRLAELLLNLIIQRKPDFKESDPQKQAVHVDRMIRLDNRAPERIEAVIRWAQADSGNGDGKWRGWQNNILSTAKLRIKFDELELKMKEQHAGNTDNRADIESFIR